MFFLEQVIYLIVCHMKTISVFLVIILNGLNINAQTLISTSLSSQATANQNQRKIVRDTAGNIYVVFADINNPVNVIRGVIYDSSTGAWNDAPFLFNGKNPTLSLSKNGQIHLFFESNDTPSKIICKSSYDFLNWTADIVISDPLEVSGMPVADADSSGKTNVFWIQTNSSSSQSLVYVNLNGDTPGERKLIMTKNSINNVAIANHLQYYNDDLFFGIQFNQDSVQFFRSTDHLDSYASIYSAKGTQPCITFNVGLGEQGHGYLDFVRLLYIDPDYQLMEIESQSPDYNICTSDVLQSGVVDYMCVDDVAPPIGYSYLFMQNGTLYHGFSYGNFINWSTIMDTIGPGAILPSVAYKTFNFSFVDFIWMEDNGNGFNIYYKHDPKHIWVGVEDKEPGKGFSITGFPNPFTEELLLNVTVTDPASKPEIQIFNTSSQLINKPEGKYSSDKKYSFRWDGRDQNGDKVKPGVFVILCTVGDKRTARKVIYINR
jgi:hypothetical protein